MRITTAAVALLLTAICSLASPYKHAAGYCMLRGRTSFFEASPKLFNEPAPVVSDLEETRSQLEYICGRQAASEILAPSALDGQSHLCCDQSQIDAMRDNFAIPVPILSSCPACWQNFVGFFCRFTCSPDQSLFLEPRVLTHNNATVKELDFYITNRMADGLYDSCKNIKYGSANELALNFLAPGSKNGFELLSFIGKDPINNPVKMIFHTDVPCAVNAATFAPNMTAISQSACPESPYKPLDYTTSLCDSEDPELRCACVDCAGVCNFTWEPLSDPDATCFVGHPRMDCWAFSAVLIYGFLTVSLLLVVVMKNVLLAGWARLRQRWRSRDDRVEEAVSSTSKLHSSLDRNSRNEAVVVDADGIPFPIKSVLPEETPLILSKPLSSEDREFVPWVVDSWLQKFFYSFGSFCARQRLIVLLMSFIVVGALSFGWIKFTVESNPINLWVDPSSNVLAQKNFFDHNFEPFYRITQLIVTRKNSSENVFNWEFLNQTLALQEAVMAVSASVDLDGERMNVSVKDLCFTPTDTSCAIQSIFEYYKEDSPFSNDVRLSYLKGCIAKPGDLPCFASSKQPLPPNLVLGGVTNPNVPHNEQNPDWSKDWYDAKAVVITFVNNNFRNETFQKMSVAWERAVVSRLQELARNDQQQIIDESSKDIDALSDAEKSDYDPNLNLVRFSYSTESSVEDELAKETTTDVLTIIISYILMFFYASIALGKFRWSTLIRNPVQLMVDSKFTLGIFGIVIVLASVSSAVGLLSFCGFKATLIIAEVIPFLVLAVGVDNIFILVNNFDRVASKCTGSGNTISVEVVVAHAVSQVGPSILLSSISETFAFGLGFFVTMPAVSIFSLYAAVSVLANVLLQMTAFVAFMTVDAKRRESGRIDCLPCVRVKTSSISPFGTVTRKPNGRIEDDLSNPASGDLHSSLDRPWLEQVFENYYAPILLQFRVKLLVVIAFLTIFVFLGVYNASQVPMGLDQRIALPRHSYLIDYFDSIETYLEVGPPLYFVVLGTGDQDHVNYLDFLSLSEQKKICGKFKDCNMDSISLVLEREYQRFLRHVGEPLLQSTVASPPAIWFDDFVSYLNNANRPCCVPNFDYLSCFTEPEDIEEEGDETGWDIKDPDRFIPSCACWKWRSIVPTGGTPGREPLFNYILSPGLRHPEDAGGLPMNRSQQMDSLKLWLKHVPSRLCPTAGKAAYGSAIRLQSNHTIKAFNVRTYHPVLRTQNDFIKAYRDAKRISETLSRDSLRLDPDIKIKMSDDGSPLPPIFPYSVFYVYFEQYLTIVNLATILILGALGAVFVIVTVFLGSPVTALIIVVVVGMMVVDLLGVMALWDISMNAVSTVNLVIAVGIGVEFCVHIARGVVSQHRYPAPVAYEEIAVNESEAASYSAVHRSLTELGSSVFSGITLTKLIGILVLAFAQTRIFEVFYFRMYLAIVLLGAGHGLILLPVLLSLLRVGEWRKGVRGAELALVGLL